MQAIKSKDTKIEVILRKELWKRGLRYRKNCSDLPGKPDIVFRGARIAVFCDSEFWHGFDWENQKNRIGTNREFWILKIERNMERDRENDLALNEMGYTVIRLWGKEIKQSAEKCADSIEQLMRQ
jgi:DNA mismatch endonuclease (patch repair protein)